MKTETRKKCAVCNSENFAKFIETSAQMHSSKEKFSFDRCADCGYVFLNPPVAPTDLKNYYTEYYLPYRGAEAWGKYSATVAKNDAKLNEKRAVLLAEHGNPNEQSAILDIGCGKPEFLLKCVEKFNCRAFGLDFTDEGWHEASEKFAKINLTVGKIGDLPDVKFDFVTMWHYLEHDYAPFETLCELREKSHKDTTLVIEVPDFESDSRRKFSEFWAGYHTPRHISVFSENNLQILLEKTGWQVIKINHYGTLDAYVLYWMSEAERRGIEWNKNMQDEFWRFVAGMIAFLPKKIIKKGESLGIMTAIAKKAETRL